MVNAEIRANEAVTTRLMSPEDAIAAGAMADLWQGFYATEISRRGFLAELTPFMERDAVKPDPPASLADTREAVKE